jgi:hypothetical protein
MTKLHANDIFKEYWQKSQDLTNTYCQLKQQRPLEPLPKLSREIWKVTTLASLWASVAKIDTRSV